ncbi:hypothetical protein [Arthrobacter sp. StoSoilB13]|uniref:hypothetical protein n=1 Tax=Arthrobacter sp. StoSoilB13 TaxID=2830993 RepID=UPI001CC77269|nr:hypothetical protein [Arthrobacter sp. StoSoilB13]BCW52046.1 hypothetical protein StoSoilB13_43880 [Arthrobacter sp. StoSoilB13]
MSIPRRKTHPHRVSDDEWQATMLARRLSEAEFEPHSTSQRSVTELSGQGLNPYLDNWIAAVNGDNAISAEALLVANTLSQSVNIGRAALTDWQHLNRDIGREPRDPRVHSELRELQAAGYLRRHQGNMYNQSGKWQIQLPKENRD